MTRLSAFHLDCTPVIPECGFNCGKCIGEMESVLGGTPGVSKFYREGDGVVVEHNASLIAVERLLDIFGNLPSFYAGRFVPTVVEKPGGQS